MTDAENIEHAEHAGNDTAERADVQAVPADFEPLTATYERLRHSTDAANILVKLSTDESVEVRKAVAGNADDKNWLVGRLTKDESAEVRDIALRNKRTSWKMRLEGAQDPNMDTQTLDFLGALGTELEPKAPAVLASMVRRAVALNPNTSPAMLAKLAEDPSGEVVRAAQSRRA